VQVSNGEKQRSSGKRDDTSKVSGVRRQKRDAERQGLIKKRLRPAVKASFDQKRME
jgi:hypothetical protein